MGKRINMRFIDNIRDDDSFSEHEVEQLFQLGENFEYGELVKQDYKTALEIYQKCADLGYTAALNKLGWFYHNGIVVEKDINKAFEYYTEAANIDDPVAMVNLGNIYENNDFEDDEIDWKNAAKWYLKAALLGDTKGKFNYANCLHYGNGVKKDYEMAFWLFRNVAKSGDNDALFYLGLYYENGFAVEKDIQKAIVFYEEGAKHGDAYCYANLARLYADGFKGQKPDNKKAAGYYLDALSHGDALGYAGIGHMYEVGAITGKEDVEKAKEWYQMAVEHDFEPAIEELERLGSEYDSALEMDEKVLRAECLLAISSLSFEDLRTATKVILKNGRCTLPLIQKNMGWGFGHTATIIENLERIGIISPKIENKITRKILINNYKEYEQFENNLKS